MSDAVIRVEGLGKRYVIGHEAERERYVALRDVLARGVKSVWRKTSDMINGRAIVPGDTTEEFWALCDVSFDVKRGEVLGVIGRNGAGKTTLLKILSRITEPSEGRVAIKGRVASLLEVGTGFHPELTGRENIYLHGAILGMTRAEIRRKFDEIVAFAEIEKFLDTPVKRYSSGMYVRLAFAVAAHLEPEILLVDEVLAVGDAEFQKKCLGKMQDVAGHGRTVLFVSHNLGAIRQLCDRGMVIRSGQLVFDGAVEKAVSLHVADMDSKIGMETEWNWIDDDAPGCPQLRLRRVAILGEKLPGPTFQSNEAIAISLQYEQSAIIRGLRFLLQIVTVNGEVAFASSDHNIRRYAYSPGKYETRCVIPANLLNRTGYILRVYADIPGKDHLIPWTDIGRFYVEGEGNQGSNYAANWPGVVCPRLTWKIISLETSDQPELLES